MKTLAYEMTMEEGAEDLCILRLESAPNDNNRRAFTIVEMLVGMAVLVVMVTFLITMLGHSSRAWVLGERRVYTDQNGRAIFDLMARDLSPAIADKRYQFVVMPGSALASKNADIVPNSSAVFFMSPIGDNGEACAVGYFLTANNPKKSYRLNRLFLKPGDLGFPTFESYVATDFNDMSSKAVWVDKIPASAFTVTGNSTSTTILSEGVIGLWASANDARGNPVPVASTKAKEVTALDFSSAARFAMASQGAFADGSTFRYLAGSTLQANKLPSSLTIGLALIDPRSLQHVAAVTTPALPDTTSDGGIDLSLTVRNYETAARNDELGQVRIFAQTMPLSGGIP